MNVYRIYYVNTDNLSLKQEIQRYCHMESYGDAVLMYIVDRRWVLFILIKTEADFLSVHRPLCEQLGAACPRIGDGLRRPGPRGGEAWTARGQPCAGAEGEAQQGEAGGKPK